MSARTRYQPWFRTVDDYGRRCAEFAAMQRDEEGIVPLSKREMRSPMRPECMGPYRMDAPDGPVCSCGQPSTHQSGWCGRPNEQRQAVIGVEARG